MKKEIKEKEEVHQRKTLIPDSDQSGESDNDSIE